jgi:hypothetical protein
MMKYFCILVVYLCVVAGACPGGAATFSGDPADVQNRKYAFAENGPAGPYVDEILTIDTFFNRVAMFHFDAEKGVGAVLRITRLTPDIGFSWGFVGINNGMYKLDGFLSGPDTVFVQGVKLNKNNHVFVHLFGEPGASLRVQVLPPLPPLPAITAFAVTPERIAAGQSAVLTWTALQADDAAITPDIGPVSPSGSLDVLPEVTTRYTLTAANGYGSTSATVDLEVVYPPQITIIEPDGENDTVYDVFTIAWTDEDPDSNAGIGLFYDTDNTGADGTLIVSGLTEDPDGDDDRYVWDVSGLAPGDYYVYAVIDDGWNPPVTAYGPGPVVVAAAVAPTVSLAADPGTISPGGSTTLSWISANADDCRIEPDIGPVGLSGSLLVSPAAVTTYTITATGPGGSAADSVTVRVGTPPEISITAPANGAAVSGYLTRVTGTITGNNIETGIVVKGVLAVIDGNRFWADNVMLADGENLITARATDARGFTAEASATVYADIAGDYIRLTADEMSGVPPFETVLRIKGPFAFTAATVSYDGPGVADITQTDDDEYRVAINDEGVYTFSATATDDEGHACTGTVTVNVLNRAMLDAMLQEKWAGMKAALLDGDVDAATEYFAESSREIFHRQFAALSASLDRLVTDMGAFRMVEVRGDQAIYDLRTVRNGKTYSFQVLFIVDGDGIWRIRTF